LESVANDTINSDWRKMTKQAKSIGKLMKNFSSVMEKGIGKMLMLRVPGLASTKIHPRI